MAQILPRHKARHNRRAGPVVYVFAAAMVMCLLYLVALSLWALTANMAMAAKDYPELVQLESDVGADRAPRDTTQRVAEAEALR